MYVLCFIYLKSLQFSSSSAKTSKTIPSLGVFWFISNLRHEFLSANKHSALRNTRKNLKFGTTKNKRITY